MRLNRFLARAGVSSRRAADRLVTDGRVTINGEPAAELGRTVDPDSDVVAVDGVRVLLPEDHTYIALNKPVGIVVTMNDPQGRPTVKDLVREAAPGLVPVGRLDADSEGLILMTNDGDLAHRIAHPSYEIDKVYEVTACGVLEGNERVAMERGIELDGKRTAPAIVDVVSTLRNTTKARVVIHEGRKRQVRRMFESVGHPVKSLRRTRIGPVELDDLRPGAWRMLSEAEVVALKRAVELED